MASYRLTPGAKADLREIGRYTQRTWGIQQRRHYLAELTRAFERLAVSPGLGRLREDLRPGLRGWSIGRHVVYYREVSGGIEVVRALHAARDAPSSL